MSILDLLGMGGEDPNSRLALAANNDARSQAAQPQTPQWGFGDPSQGNPLIGQQSYPDDNKIDADTGVSNKFLRQDANKQALMTGLMLIAAGTSRDDGARAQIMGGLANTMDSSSRIQNFAKMRLDMAKARLADQQAKSSAAADAAFAAQYGGGAPATPPAAATAVPGAQAAPAPAPAPSGPMAAAVGPQAAPAAAAVASGTGNAADAAIAAAAGGGAPQAAPPPTSVLGQGGPMTLPSKAPDKMDIPGNLATYTPTAQERQEILAMGREKGEAEVARRTDALRNQEYPGSPIMVEGTNDVKIPIYKHGALTGYQAAGAGTTSASIEKDPTTGDNVLVTRDGRGNRTSISAYEGANQKDQERMTQADTAAAQANAATLKTQYSGLADAGQRFARAEQAKQDIAAGNVNTGPASGWINYGKRIADTFGQLSDDEKKKLLATDNAAGLEGTIVAKLAKANNGSQVTDADVKFAQNIVTGGGSPDEIAAALTRYQQDLRNDVNLYNTSAQRHNDLLGGVKAGGYVAGQLKADTVKGDFGTLGDSNTPAYASAKSGAQPAPNQPTTPLGMLGGAMGGGGAAPIQGAPSAAKAFPAGPQAGTVSKGYRFKGGDPSKQENWEKV